MSLRATRAWPGIETARMCPSFGSRSSEESIAWHCLILLAQLVHFFWDDTASRLSAAPSTSQSWKMICSMPIPSIRSAPGWRADCVLRFPAILFKPSGHPSRLVYVLGAPSSFLSVLFQLSTFHTLFWGLPVTLAPFLPPPLLLLYHSHWLIVRSLISRLIYHHAPSIQFIPGTRCWTWPIRDGRKLNKVSQESLPDC